MLLKKRKIQKSIIVPTNKNRGLKKPLSRFRTIIYSRHPSHRPLRKLLQLNKFRSLIRLGSVTSGNDGKNRIELNSVQGVKNSANKFLMKQCFTKAGVKTPSWWVYGKNAFIRQDANMIHSIDELPYPIISKSLGGSRGVGNCKHNDAKSLKSFIETHNTSLYIFEQFVPLGREYRLHISRNGCFYTCRKLLKPSAPKETWQMHDDVTSWILESNSSFKKPNNWDEIVSDCIKAQRSLGLDICAFDVMVQSNNESNSRTNFEWLICESCSAPSFGNVTLQKYIEEIPKILNQKFREK